MVQRSLLFVFLIFLTDLAVAQQRSSLMDCEKAFLRNNLTLLAAHYNVDVAKSAVVQARIWEQPVVSGEFNAINPQDRRLVDVGARGQKALAIQQLVYIGSKKQREIEWAKTGVDIATLQFEQLLRNLRFQLHVSFYKIYFDLQKIANIQAQIARIDTLVNAYAAQAAKSNVPLKDVVRLQSLSLSLRNEVMATQKDVNYEQESIKIITGFDSAIVPTVDEAVVGNMLNNDRIERPDSLISKALNQNLDYQMQQKMVEAEDKWLRWQQSLNTPDIVLGVAYDQRGGAFANQINVTVGMPIPLWQKNRGNVQAAECQLKQSVVLKDHKARELKSRIESAYDTWRQQYALYKQTAMGSFASLETVYAGMLENFQKRNIPLLDFTDFMESYNETIVQLNDMKKQLVISCETLNYVVNDTLF